LSRAQVTDLPADWRGIPYARSVVPGSTHTGWRPNDREAPNGEKGEPIMTARQLYSRVSVEAGIESLEESRQATAAVLRALRDRLTPEEAAQAAAQLPAELKRLWASGRPSPRPIKLHRREFLQRVQLDGGLTSLNQAEMVTDAVFAALKEQLSEGEADDILSQLPRDLKTQWTRA
jgi:uncharacterized protein (DUF2267 family)